MVLCHQVDQGRRLGATDLTRVFHKASQFTVSNALSSLRKPCTVAFTVRYSFSCSFLTENIISIVFLPDLNTLPVRLEGRCYQPVQQEPRRDFTN